jgi:hypothetical protein
MKALEFQDQRQLEAAQGWFELGNCIEATEELEQITPEVRAHLSVLDVGFQTYAAAKKWEYVAEIAKAISEFAPQSPLGLIHLAYSPHELKLTREAWNMLLPVADKFPKEYIIRHKAQPVRTAPQTNARRHPQWQVGYTSPPVRVTKVGI